MLKQIKRDSGNNFPTYNTITESKEMTTITKIKNNLIQL